MSIDDRNILSRLRRMGDRELTQYGQLNQNNPYLFPLVFQESQDRKEIRAGSLASNSRGNMPSVKEQALTTMAQPAASPQSAPTPSQVQPQDTETQMAANGGYMDSQLPEEMGIGALPERSLSGMADGGIVGFNEGGDIQRFQSGGTPAGRMLDAINEVDELKGRISQKYKDSALVFPGMFKEQTDAERENAKAIMGRLNSMSPTEMRFVLENGVLPQGSSTFQPYDRNRKGNAPFAASVDNAAVPPNIAALPPPPPPAAAPPAAAAARPTGATTGATTGASTNVSTGAGLASLASQYDNINTAGMSRADILAAKEQFEKGIAAIDPVRTQREELAAKSKKFSQDALDEFEKETKDRPDPYAKREERANKQEASIAESAERNPYLSLMEAGFAMMSGTSQYAFENIGKGAMVGTKAYKEGLDKIELAKTKLSETRDKIEDYRINRDDLTTKERRAFKTDIRNTELAGDKLMMDGMALAFNNKREDVNKALEAYQTSHNNEVNRRTQADIAKINELGAGQRTMYSTDAQVRMSNADRSARASEADANRKMQEKIAGMPGPLQKLLFDLGKGDIVKGYEIYNEKTQYEDKLFMDWSKRSEDPITGENFRKRYPTAQVYVEAARRNGTGVVDVDTLLRTR